MNDYILINTPTAIAIIVLLVFLGVMACIESLLLGMASDKIKAQNKKIESFKDKLSDRELEISILKTALPEE